MMMGKIRNTILLLALCASSAGAKCFSADVSAIAFSTAVHTGQIVSLKKIPRGCEMTLEIKGVKIDGISEAPRHCNSKVGAVVTLRTRPYCCDQPPCSPDTPNEIRFLLPPEAGSHKTVGEIFNVKPEDIRINIQKWADFGNLKQRSDFGKKEEASFREDLTNYVEISDAEHEAMMVSLIGMGERAGTMTFPDGIVAAWQQLNYLHVRVAMDGAKSRPMVFAPRGWLKTIEWEMPNHRIERPAAR